MSECRVTRAKVSPSSQPQRRKGRRENQAFHSFCVFCVSAVWLQFRRAGSFGFPSFPAHSRRPRRFGRLAGAARASDLGVESFVDGQLFRGTSYKASNWTRLGPTAGFGRRHQPAFAPLCPGVEPVADTSNEIPAPQKLIERAPILPGQRVSLDAMHTRHKTGVQILYDKEADYLLPLKGNQETFLATAPQLLPESVSPSGRERRRQSQPAGTARAGDPSD